MATAELPKTTPNTFEIISDQATASIRGKKKFVVAYRLPGDPTRRRKFFDSSQDRSKWTQDQFKKYGTDENFDQPGYHEYLAAKQILAPKGISVLEAARYVAEKDFLTFNTVTLREAADKFLKSKLENRNYPHLKKHIDTFCHWFGPETGLGEIDNHRLSQFREWLETDDSFKGGKLSPYGQKNYVRNTLTFLNWCSAQVDDSNQRWIQSDQFDLFKAPDVQKLRKVQKRAVVEITPLSIIKKLFKANREADPGFCGLLSLQTHFALRTSLIAPDKQKWEAGEYLEPHNIDFHERVISIERWKMKVGNANDTFTQRWNEIPAFEPYLDNMFGWLELLKPEDFGLKRRQWQHRLSMACKRAKVDKVKDIPRNGFRHAGATHIYQLTGSMDTTRNLLDHHGEGKSITSIHYLRDMAKREAEDFFNVSNR